EVSSFSQPAGGGRLLRADTPCVPRRQRDRIYRFMVVEGTNFAISTLAPDVYRSAFAGCCFSVGARAGLGRVHRRIGPIGASSLPPRHVADASSGHAVLGGRFRGGPRSIPVEVHRLDLPALHHSRTNPSLFAVAGGSAARSLLLDSPSLVAHHGPRRGQQAGGNRAF